MTMRFGIAVPAGTFLLQSGNRRFIEGKSGTVYATGFVDPILYMAMGLVCLWACLTLMWFVTLAGQCSSPPDCVVEGAGLFLSFLIRGELLAWTWIAMLVGSVLFLWWEFSRPNGMFGRTRRLAREGSLRIGEVLHCWTVLKKGDGDSSDYYEITVYYTFTSPKGQVMDDVAAVKYYDDEYCRISLPHKGTPVAVLWVDEHLYEPL